jgi:creatinine amidohydrolase
MLFDDMNWMDIEHYLAVHDTRVVVITGAVEQHAYLSVSADILAPLAVAKAACQRAQVAIAPPVYYGVSPYFTRFPGTVSLSPETFTAVMREVLEGLVAQGFTRVLVSNGHGGNTGILIPLLVELANAHPEARFGFYEWWRNDRVAAVAGEAGLPTAHANWSEALPVCRVAPLPEGDKPRPEVPRTASAQAVRDAIGDGSYGGPYDAPPEVIEKLFEAAVAAMIEALGALE